MARGLTCSRCRSSPTGSGDSSACSAICRRTAPAQNSCPWPCGGSPRSAQGALGNWGPVPACLPIAASASSADTPAPRMRPSSDHAQPHWWRPRGEQQQQWSATADEGTWLASFDLAGLFLRFLCLGASLCAYCSALCALRLLRAPLITASDFRRDFIRDARLKWRNWSGDKGGVAGGGCETSFNLVVALTRAPFLTRGMRTSWLIVKQLRSHSGT